MIHDNGDGDDEEEEEKEEDDDDDDDDDDRKRRRRRRRKKRRRSMEFSSPATADPVAIDCGQSETSPANCDAHLVPAPKTVLLLLLLLHHLLLLLLLLLLHLLLLVSLRSFLAGVAGTPLRRWPPPISFDQVGFRRVDCGSVSVKSSQVQFS